MGWNVYVSFLQTCKREKGERRRRKKSSIKKKRERKESKTERKEERNKISVKEVSFIRLLA
jgi:hypothetical protein